MKFAIVEDRQEDRDKLCSMLEQYFSANSVAAELVCFPSGEAALENFQPGQYSCMFLDIYMGGVDGMETARKIYRLDPACRLIFCTDSIAHAVTSYEVRAAWYLTKPLNARLLTDALDAVCLDMLRSSRTLDVHVKGHALQVRLGDVCYVDCSDRQAQVHLREKTLAVDEAVGDVLGQLRADARFLTCNRNTVVNMDHVDRVDDHDFRMKNGVCVPLRQRGRAALKKEYLAWSLRELRKEERM